MTSAGRPIRVLHVLKYYRPDFSGEAVFLERSSVLMRDFAPEMTHDLLVTHTPRPKEAMPRTPNLERVTYVTQTAAIGTWRREAALALWFATHLHRYDVVHVRTHADWYFISYLMAKLAGRRLILTATLDDSVPALVDQYRRSLRPLARAGFRLFDAFVSISPKLQAQTASLMDPGRCHLVPLGADIVTPDPSWRAQTRERLGIPPDALALVFVGGLCARKDPLFLVQQMPAVLARRPDARLMLVGPPLEAGHVAAIHEAAREAAIGDRVILVGEVTDANPYFAAADIMAFASHAEGFGLVVPEAMSHGLPVVVRHLPGVNDSFVRQGETGFLFTDAEGYQAAILPLVSDAHLRAEVGARARTLVTQSFTMESAARAYLDLYRGATSPAGAKAMTVAAAKPVATRPVRAIMITNTFPPGTEGSAAMAAEAMARAGRGAISVIGPRHPNGSAHDRAAPYRIWRTGLRETIWDRARLVALLAWAMAVNRTSALVVDDGARFGWLKPAGRLLGFSTVIRTAPDQNSTTDPARNASALLSQVDQVLAPARLRAAHGRPMLPPPAGPLPRPAPKSAIDLSGVASPLLLVLIDAEEEFDWQQISSASVSVESMRHQVRAQRIFERYGVKPMYMVDYPVVSQPDGFRPLQEMLASGVADVGAQLHPWVNPPIEEAVSEYMSFPGNLPERLERAKLARLTREIEDRFGRHPDAYRAGRYGAGPNTPQILIDLGYRIDCSVLPANDFSDVSGPDYTSWSAAPTWLDESRQLLELPATVGFAGRLARHGGGLYAAITSHAPARARVPGVFARTGLLERIKLTPEGTSLAEAKRLTRAMLAQGHKVFAITYHSPSLDSGHTPYVRNQADLARFLAWLDQYCGWFLGDMGGVPATAGGIFDLARGSASLTALEQAA